MGRKKSLEDPEVEYLPFEDFSFLYPKSQVIANRQGDSSLSSNIQYQLPSRSHKIRYYDDNNGIVAPPLTPTDAIGTKRKRKEKQTCGMVKKSKHLRNLDCIDEDSAHSILRMLSDSSGGPSPSGKDFDLSEGLSKDVAHKETPQIIQVDGKKYIINQDGIYEEASSHDCSSCTGASNTPKYDFNFNKSLARTNTPTMIEVDDIDGRYILNLDRIIEEETRDATRKMIKSLDKSAKPNSDNCFRKKKSTKRTSPHESLDKGQGIVDVPINIDVPVTVDALYEEATQEETQQLIESIKGSVKSKGKRSSAKGKMSSRKGDSDEDYHSKNDAVVLTRDEEQVRDVLLAKGYSKEAAGSISKLIESNSPTRSKKGGEGSSKGSEWSSKGSERSDQARLSVVRKRKRDEEEKLSGALQTDGSCQADIEREITSSSTPKSTTSKDEEIDHISEETSTHTTEQDLAKPAWRCKYEDLTKATDNFANNLKIGKGPLGAFYKGILPKSNTEIAVKVITHSTRQRPSLTEVSTLSQLEHPNLVKLLGYCKYSLGKYHVIYEWIPGGSLSKALFGRKPTQAALPWSKRFSVLGSVARALQHLHENGEKPIVHRNVRASNIMLETEKLGDFGLAWLLEHMVNLDPNLPSPARTYGMIAPEYALSKKATTKTDVYAFGILCLEVASGRHLFSKHDLESKNLVVWIMSLCSQNKLLEAIDKDLLELRKNSEMETQIELVLRLGIQCSNLDPNMRPSIKEVGEILDGKAPLPSFKHEEFVASISPPIQLFEPKILIPQMSQFSESSSKKSETSPSASRSSLPCGDSPVSHPSKKQRVPSSHSVSFSSTIEQVSPLTQVTSLNLSPPGSPPFESLQSIEYIPYGEVESIGMDVFDDPSRTTVQCIETFSSKSRNIIDSESEALSLSGNLDPLLSVSKKGTAITLQTNDNPSSRLQSRPDALLSVSKKFTSLTAMSNQSRPDSLLSVSQKVTSRKPISNAIPSSHLQPRAGVDCALSSCWRVVGHEGSTLETKVTPKTSYNVPLSAPSLSDIDLDKPNPSIPQANTRASSTGSVEIFLLDKASTAMDIQICGAVTKIENQMGETSATLENLSVVSNSLQEDHFGEAVENPKEGLKGTSMDQSVRSLLPFEIQQTLTFNTIFETVEKEAQDKGSSVPPNFSLPKFDENSTTSSHSFPMQSSPCLIQVDSMNEHGNVEMSANNNIFVPNCNSRKLSNNLSPPQDTLTTILINHGQSLDLEDSPCTCPESLQSSANLMNHVPSSEFEDSPCTCPESLQNSANPINHSPSLEFEDSPCTCPESLQASSNPINNSSSLEFEDSLRTWPELLERSANPNLGVSALEKENEEQLVLEQDSAPTKESSFLSSPPPPSFGDNL
ncbi:unnamed protein product [Calypogeia fissa]